MANNNHNQDAGDSGKRQESKAERSERKAEAYERGDIANSVESYNDNLKAQSKEQKISGRSKVTGKGQGADGKGGFSSAKDLLGDLAHETLTKDAEKKQMSPQRKAQILAEVERDGYIVGKPQEQAAPKGSAEDTGKVTDYKPKQNSQGAFSLGMNYEDGKPESKNLVGKFSDFAEAAARNATSPKGWQDWFDGELQKGKGIAEGLNEAKEETKAAAMAGFKALTDGTVANFLAKPNAINKPFFKSVANVFESISSDPNATNKALDALGHAVMQASDEYSALPAEEQGKVIGKFAFGLVNPEGSTEGAKVALKIADNIATHVDKAVMDTISVSMKAAERAAGQSPELLQEAKQRLLDYLNSKGLLGQRLEYAGIPDGYFDGLTPSVKENENLVYSTADKSHESGGELSKSTERESAQEKIQGPSEKFLNELNKTIEGLAPDEREFLEAHHIQIRAVRRISDIIPGKERLGACYSPKHGAIFVPEETLRLGKWVSNDDLPFAVRHEFGHVLNAKESEQAILNGKYISDKTEFKEAYNLDEKNLKPEQLEELQLNAHGKVSARDEVFADMYAHVTFPDGSNNPYSQKLKAAFPNFLKAMEDLLNDQ